MGVKASVDFVAKSTGVPDQPLDGGVRLRPSGYPGAPRAGWLDPGSCRCGSLTVGDKMNHDHVESTAWHFLSSIGLGLGRIHCDDEHLGKRNRWRPPQKKVS